MQACGGVVHDGCGLLFARAQRMRFLFRFDFYMKGGQLRNRAASGRRPRTGHPGARLAKIEKDKKS